MEEQASRDPVVQMYRLSRATSFFVREEAKTLFLKSPFFGSWDPASLDAYIQYGLTSVVRDGKEVGVRLKTPGK